MNQLTRSVFRYEIKKCEQVLNYINNQLPKQKQISNFEIENMIEQIFNSPVEEHKNRMEIIQKLKEQEYET